MATEDKTNRQIPQTAETPQPQGRAVELTYADLRKYPNQIADLVDAYNVFYNMPGVVFGSGGSRADIMLSAMRVLLNPEYHTHPNDFPFIQGELERWLGKEHVQTFLKEISEKSNSRATVPSP